MELVSLQGSKGTAAARNCTRGRAGRGASVPGGAGGKLGASGDVDIALGVEMVPSLAGGSKIEGTSCVLMMWVKGEAGGSDDPGPSVCMLLLW